MSDHTIAESEEPHGFVAKRHELCELVTLWMTEMIENDFFFFCYQQASGSDGRRDMRRSYRIRQIATCIGEEAVERAIDQAYRDCDSKYQGQAAWRIFRYGTDEERSAFHACDAAQLAKHCEEEDLLHASILKFLAGEPHDLQAQSA